MITPVYKCSCNHFYVGDHGCPKCKAPWLATHLVMRVASRTLARKIAERLRIRPDQLTWYKERFHKESSK